MNIVEAVETIMDRARHILMKTLVAEGDMNNWNKALEHHHGQMRSCPVTKKRDRLVENRDPDYKV